MFGRRAAPQPLDNVDVHTGAPSDGADPDAESVGDEASPGNGPATNTIFMPVLVSANFVSVMASDMVNVVLPDMREDFGVSAGQAGWVVTGYMLSYAVGVPLYGKVSDFFGLRRHFSAALLVFAAGSVGCAIASDLAVLVFGRIVQGAGAATIPALGLRDGGNPKTVAGSARKGAAR